MGKEDEEVVNVCCVHAYACASLCMCVILFYNDSLASSNEFHDQVLFHIQILHDPVFSPFVYWFQVHRNNEYVYEARNVPCHAYTKIGSSFIFAWGVWENEKKVIKQQIEMFSFLFIEQNQ